MAKPGGDIVDGVTIALGLGCGVYLMWRYPTLAQNLYANKTESAVVGIVLIPLLLEVLRRSAGTALLIVVVGFWSTPWSRPWPARHRS